MKVQVFQHVAFEDAGMIRNWLDARECDVRIVRWFAGQVPSSEPDDFDLIVVLGGPMSVNDEATLPWLKAEKAYLLEAVERGVRVLGVCLGAQMIAAALGSRIYRNPVKEIGWFPVRRASGASEESFVFPDECLVFHWHGETFDLPPGAVHLAESAGCPVQAFQIGRQVIGLQFHLEVTMSGACMLTEHCTDDLAPGPYVQDEQALLNATPDHNRSVHELLDRVLSYLTSGMRRAA